MRIANPRSLFTLFGIALGLVVLIAYGFFQAHEFISGPSVEIASPRNGETIASTSPSVLLKGTARNISFLSINGLPTFTDENGDFSRTLLLPVGYTIITVEAQDKFKRSIRKEIQLFVR